MRYGWYESEESLTISVWVKNVAREDVDVSESEGVLTVKAREETLALKLKHPVEISGTDVTPLKIEVLLRKKAPGRWRSLAEEGPAARLERKEIGAGMEAEDEVYSNDPLMDMFKRLYDGASDETKRAMNKSFVESKGTTLSTSWKDVSKGDLTK